MEVQEEQLWLDYRVGDESAREELLRRYLPFAKRVAGHVYSMRYSNEVEFGDYQQLAYIGLLDAMRRFRPELGVQFSTFATYRIKGAIFNGIPKMTERGDYHRYLKEARRDRTASLGGNSAPSGLEAIRDLIIGIALTYQLDDLAEQDGDGQRGEVEPYASRFYDELQSCLREVVAELPERDQRIIYYHYFYQMSFEAIAVVLELTKGRVSQLHKRALENIRAALSRRKLTGLY